MGKMRKFNKLIEDTGYSTLIKMRRNLDAEIKYAKEEKNYYRGLKKVV